VTDVFVVLEDRMAGGQGKGAVTSPISCLLDSSRQMTGRWASSAQL
jgi:hypothetical protein